MLKADPIRVLQAIVVGISFLGAATIMHDRDTGIEGLTTAATIYLTAGIGVAVAVDRIILAVVITAAAVAVWVLIGRLEQTMAKRRDQKSTSA